MFIIDQYAYSNKLKDVHPMEKIAFALITMCIAIASQSIAVHVLVMSSMVFMTLAAARIPRKAYLGLLLLPLSFMLISILPIFITISDNSIQYLFSLKLLNLNWGVTRFGLHSARLLLFRSIAAVMCLYFLALTTPLLDMLEMLKKLKLPGLLIELMSLIYRFIFVLIEAAVVIFQSQASRLGYSNVRNSFFSLGKLVSMVFIRAYHQSQMLYLSLMARGFQGDLCVISNEYRLNQRNIILIVIFDALLIVLSLILGGN